MFEEDLFDYVLEQLAEEIATRETPAPDPLPHDSYIARSALQKAIRRGLTDLALRAAARLLQLDGRVLWRRLVVIALEDLGPAQADLLARIVAAGRDPAWRLRHGGDWVVAAELVRQACEGTRCASANDLYNIAVNDPALDAFKGSLCDATPADLLTLAVDEARPFGERGVAVLLMLGESCGPAAPDHIRADPTAVFHAFARAGHISHVAMAYHGAYRATRLALAPLGLALWRSANSAETTAADDDLTALNWAGEVPTACLDQYTRGGKAALGRYVVESSAWAAFARRAGVKRTENVAAAGELLFRAEGAQLAARRQWQGGLKLRAASASLGCFMPWGGVEEGIALIRRQLPLIDDLRARHITTNPTA